MYNLMNLKQIKTIVRGYLRCLFLFQIQKPIILSQSFKKSIFIITNQIIKSLRIIIYIIMAEELWKYLPHVPSTIKKSNPILKRKSEVTDKQVLNLTGGVFPVKIIDPAKDNSICPQKLDHWIYTPIRQKNTKIGPIKHWVKEGDQEKLYQGEKFNIQSNILEFSEQQYSKIDVDHEKWPYLQVLNIFNQLKTFNFNFIVVHDRLESDKWNVQDLKDIFFTVNRLILQARDERENVLSNYIYDKKHETNRKFELEKYMMRNKIDTDRQKFLINEIRRLQILIKKQQRQQINLKKALKIDEVPEEVFKIDEVTDLQNLYANQRVYSRQQLLSKPIQLPGKIEEKLTEVMHGLNIPDKIIATKQNMELYDKLRKRILVMFSIQRYNRKRESEKRSIEEKKKKVLTQEEDNRKMYPLKASQPQPRKKQKN